MQSAPQQLSFDDIIARQAMNARDAGMIEAEFAETLSGSDYPEALYAAICHVARRQIEVHIDDVLRHCKVQASHPNAAGSAWVRAIKDGVILRTGTVRPCLSDPKKRVHNYPLYRSGLFHGRSA
jgi:hypothetical protein